jgi:hypothetical protein
MILSRLKTVFAAGKAARGSRQFRDPPAPRPGCKAARPARTSEIHPVRLVGYFVGGIMLANLVLMTSAAFRGDAASAPMHNPGLMPKRGPAAAVNAAVMLPQEASSAERETAAPAIAQPLPAPIAGPPAITSTCIEAREKLVGALTLYYLQRSRRPRASAEEVSETAQSLALLAGPVDPALSSASGPCAG